MKLLIVIVEGIVTGGYTNKNGFFLSDASGVIPVLPTDGQTTCNELSIGNKVIVKGKRVTYKKSADGNYFGQIQIESAEVLTNLGGNNEISSASYIKDKAIEEILHNQKHIRVKHMFQFIHHNILLRLI